MDERILKWLYDIKLAVEEIDLYFKIQIKTFLSIKKTQCLKEQLKGI